MININLQVIKVLKLIQMFGDRLFQQQSVVETSYFSMTQGSGHYLLLQQNDPN